MQEILHCRTSHKPRTVRLAWFCLALNTPMIKCAVTRVCPSSQQIFTVRRTSFTSVASFILYSHSILSVYWIVQFPFLFGHHSFYCTWLLRVLKRAASISCFFDRNSKCVYFSCKDPLKRCLVIYYNNAFRFADSLGCDSCHRIQYVWLSLML